jgi:hypothetical protein
MAEPTYKSDDFGSETVIRSEHIGPRKTGDNIEAKRVASYVWNSNTLQWERMTQPGGGSGGTVTQGTAGTDPWLIIDEDKQDTLAYAKVLTSGDTITPTTGKRIKVVKSQILQNPGNSTFNLVTLSFSGSIGDFFKCWVGSDSSVWVGDVDEALTIGVSGSDQVSVNIRYKEL